MTIHLTSNNAQRVPGEGLASTASVFIHDLDKQRLRILRCTALALASGPGGLRYKAGTRPWLDGLPVGRPVAARATGRGGKAVSIAAAD